MPLPGLRLCTERFGFQVAGKATSILLVGRGGNSTMNWISTKNYSAPNVKSAKVENL